MVLAHTTSFCPYHKIIKNENLNYLFLHNMALIITRSLKRKSDQVLLDMNTNVPLILKK